jgi:hypothetical protein
VRRVRPWECGLVGTRKKPAGGNRFRDFGEAPYEEITSAILEGRTGYKASVKSIGLFYHVVPTYIGRTTH